MASSSGTSQDARWPVAMFRDMTFFLVPFAKITLLRFLQLALGPVVFSQGQKQMGQKEKKHRKGEPAKKGQI